MEKENNGPLPWNLIPDGICEPRQIWYPFARPRIVRSEIKIRQYKDDEGSDNKEEQMLDHKTWQEDPNLIGQISINTEFITMLGFFLKHFGTELMEAQKKATDSNKKLRIIVDYDPEEKKSMISFSFYEQCNHLEDQRTHQADPSDVTRLK